MHSLVHSGPTSSPIAVVEIKSVKGLWEAGFTTLSEELLSGTFKDLGYKWDDVARYSLSFTGGVPSLKAQEILGDAMGWHKIILAVGVEATKILCDTKRPLKDYAGCLTALGDTWVLPTFHPNGVGMGQYDQFDDLYYHVRRAVDLVRGDLPMPTGEKVEWEFFGHNGSPREDKVWSGYFECTAEEKVKAEAQLWFWVDHLDSGQNLVFGLDTESYTTDHFKPLTMVQVYDSIQKKGYAFNWGVVEKMKGLFQLFLNHENARFVLHNTKHDRKMLKHWLDVDLGDRDTDTMMMAMGLTEKGRQCGLKYLSRQYCNAPFYDEGLSEFLDKSDINYGHIRPDVLAEYGCLDVYYTYSLAQILPKLVEREGTTSLVNDILLPAQRTLADIEYKGMEVDLEFAKAKSAEWAPRIDDAIRKVQDYARDVGFPQDNSGIGSSYKEVCSCVPVRARFHLEGARVLSYAKRLRESEIEIADCELCGNKRYVTGLDVTLNVNSYVHMQHLCFDILYMQETHKGRKCDKDFWALNEDHPLARLVHEYKEIYYLRRNFLEGVQQYVREDGRVHPDFLLFGTKTGRLAIHDPAMQTVPSHGENAKVAKQIFKASDGHVIVNGDYKSLEMFVNAYLTGDEQLLDDLLTKDVYKATAMDMFYLEYDQVSPEQRQAAKPVVLGSGYGIGAKKLARTPVLQALTGGDPNVAQGFLDAFWGRYSTWKKWTEKQHADAFNLGRVTTELGRVRRWNLITEENQWSVRNQAQNFPGQSLGSDICLSALVRLHKALTHNNWGSVLLTVHDSIVFEVKEEHLHEGVKLAKEIMENPPIETEVPFRVDFEWGYNYGEKEEYRGDL